MQPDQPHINYYTLLDIPSSASPEEITEAYRKQASFYRPDKHRDERLSKEAERKFKLVTNAHDVLSDPIKRALYDKFGVDGLSYSNWQAERSPEEVVRDYEKFQNTSSSSPFSLEGRTSVPLNFYDRMQRTSISQKLRCAVNENTEFRLGANTAPLSFGIGVRRHIFTTGSIGAAIIFSSRDLTYNIHLKHPIRNFGVGKMKLNGSLKPGGAPGSIQLGLLSKIAPNLTGDLTLISQQDDAYGPILVSMLKYKNQWRERNYLFKTMFTKPMMKSDFSILQTLSMTLTERMWFSLGGRMMYPNLLTPSIFISLAHDLGRGVSINAALSWDAYPSNSLMFMFEINYQGQTLSLPLWLSDTLDLLPVVLGLGVPALVATGLHFFWFKKKEKRKESRQEFLRKRILVNRERAKAYLELVCDEVQRKLARETAVNGLIIHEARYGNVNSDGSPKGLGVDDMPPFCDVTLALQNLVVDSTLSLSKSSKSELDGFYDPCIDEKFLWIKYSYKTTISEMYIRDGEPLEIPL